MFGTIKSNLVILAVAIVVMFIALAADAQGVTEVKLDHSVSKYSTTDTYTIRGTLTDTTRFSIVDRNSKTTTKITTTIGGRKDTVSLTPSLTIKNGTAVIDSGITIKGDVSGFDLFVKTSSIDNNRWTFGASNTFGQFDVSVKQTFGKTETTSASVKYNITDSKWDINTTVKDNGSYSVSLKKGY